MILKNNVEQYFKLPILFSNNNRELSDKVIEDLELMKIKDENNKNNVRNDNVKKDTIHKKLLNINTIFNDLISKQWVKNYTTDIDYLNSTQKIILDMSKNKTNIENDKIINSSWESFKDIKEDKNFINKYQFINFNVLKFLNTSILFLTIFYIYSISSPTVNLMAPLSMLVIPFFILKIKKIPITFVLYYQLLLASIKKNNLGKIVTQWTILSWSQRMYFIIMIGLYIYNMYQNILSCYSFYKNTSNINSNITNIKRLLQTTEDKINDFLEISKQHSSYSKYNKYLESKLINIKKLKKELIKVPKAGFSIKKLPFIGYTMKQYYLLYESKDIEETVMFCFGFNCYINKIHGIIENIENKNIHKSHFSNSDKVVSKFTNMYNPNIQCDKIVKNNITVKSNKIITGPNASGKTTLIKTLFLNVILSQQIGFGYFDKATITPFDYFHCYINIPDTSSRDSLFQAEARQCLEIVNNITKNKDKKHLCIFDELFSGTNPVEAVSSAYSYLDFIANNKNVKFILTTHFIDLCKKFKNSKTTKNIHMKTIMNENNESVYKYKIKKGISTIKGGVSVLKKLSYPNEIIVNTLNDLKNKN